MSQQNSSGTPAVANVSPAPAPTSTPAPSVVATPEQPLTLADYDRLAAASILASAEPPSGPAPAASATGQEPAPVTPATPAPAPENPPTAEAVQTPGTEAAADEDIHDPTPEELAVLNEPGQRALKAEREKRKAAKAEVAELKARLAELEAKLPANANPDPNAPQAPATPEAQPAQPTTATPSVATPALADCQTFEQVEARALAATQMEATVTGLQTQLQRNGHEAVAAQLAQMGVQKIGDTPLAEATPEMVGDFLQGALNGAKLTQAQVAPRKRWIGEQNQSWLAAAKVLPDINNPKTPTAQAVASIVNANPEILRFAKWPQIAVKLYLGEQVFNRAQPGPATPAPAKPAVIKPAPETVPAPAKPAAKQAPGAPAISAAALPKSNRLDELSAKLQKGTATLDEVDEYGRLSVSL